MSFQHPGSGNKEAELENRRQSEIEINVLFTSVGRRVELMNAFRSAFDRLELRGRLVATDIDALAPALQAVDQAYLVPPVHDPGLPQRLIEICESENIHLVFPLIDPDIPMLAKHADQFESVGARAVVVSAQAAEITRDKWQTVQFLTSLAIPTPRSWLGDHIKGQTLEYPLFVKPRFGSAGKGSFRVDDARALMFMLDYVPDPIVQEFLPGPEITSDVICGLEGELWAVVSRERIEVRWGEVAKGKTIFRPEIQAACVKVAESLGAVGPITMQCMEREGELLFTEINARFGGGHPLAIQSGVPSVEWYLRQAAGQPVEVPPLGSYRKGLYITRFDQSYFLSDEELDQA